LERSHSRKTEPQEDVTSRNLGKETQACKLLGATNSFHTIAPVSTKYGTILEEVFGEVSDT
jgi:hypothetical protein